MGDLADTVPESVKPASQLTPDQRKAKIRRLLPGVRLHLQVRDWEGAVSLLFELVELSTGNASYRGMLARAMTLHPIMRKDAERHFIDALRLRPQSAELHFSLGLYYKSFGLKARAKNEFRTALRIYPEHERAQKYLLGNRKTNRS